MRRTTRTGTDFSVLVDVLSNMAGMMVLMACVALLVRDAGTPGQRERDAKPINYPMAYLPIEKRPVAFCIKYGRFYELPEEALLAKITEGAADGEPVEWVELTKDGVFGRIDVTDTATGFKFQFKLLEDQQGGTPVNDQVALAKRLDGIVATFPPDRFFYVIHTWDDAHAPFREIREYLLEQGVEVGWSPHAYEFDYRFSQYDVVYAIGQYSKDFSSIKAQ